MKGKSIVIVIVISYYGLAVTSPRTLSRDEDPSTTGRTTPLSTPTTRATLSTTAAGQHHCPHQQHGRHCLLRPGQ